MINEQQLSFLPAEPSENITTNPSGKEPAKKNYYPAPAVYAVPDNLPVMNLNEDPDRPFWVAWNKVSGIGGARFEKLLQCFGSAESAWGAPAKELREAGLDEKLAADVVVQRQKIFPEAEMQKLVKARAAAITLRDKAYPYLLRNIPNPPFVLYARGELTAADDLAIAIVGTRKITSYGRMVTTQISKDLAERGVTIVSGLARGVDMAAHTAALEAGGRTIAVLGCGVDIVYPPEHARLAAKIVERGAIVSEFSLGAPPEAGNFPARNRIISGLCSASIITEAPERSGALITADFAREHGREVMAVPGSIFNERSRGCLAQIQHGAHCVTSAQDVIQHLNDFLLPEQIVMREIAPVDEFEASILQIIANQALHIDEICRLSNSPISAISGSLMMLEIKGMARNLGGMVYTKV